MYLCIILIVICKKQIKEWGMQEGEMTREKRETSKA